MDVYFLCLLSMWSQIWRAFPKSLKPYLILEIIDGNCPTINLGLRSFW